MYNHKRFHPLALVIRFFESITSILGALIAGIIGIFSGHFWLLLFPIIYISVEVISYMTTYYTVDEQNVTIQKGLINKSTTVIPYDRIQTVRQSQWFFLAPFDLTTVNIETAGGSDSKSEGVLTVVPIAVFDLIESYRSQEAPVKTATQSSSEVNQTDGDATATKPQFKKLPASHILLFAITNLNILASSAVIAGLGGRFLNHAGSKLNSEVSRVIFSSVAYIALSIFGVLLLGFIYSLIRTLLTYYDFRIARTGNTLVIKSGLLKEKTQQIPLHKIQNVQVKKHPIRRLFGFSSILVYVYSGQDKQSKEDSSNNHTYLFPIIKNAEVYPFLATYLPEWQLHSPKITLLTQNRLWYFVRWTLLVIGILAVLEIIFWQVVPIWVVGLVILFFALVLLDEYLEAKGQGYGFSQSRFICIQRYHLFTKEINFLDKNKVQNVTQRTTPLLYHRQKIGHIKLPVKMNNDHGDQLKLRFIPIKVIQEIRDFYEQ
ncbi:PH domain-containing protein [Holzapfeliella sp. He02]|uniref:PH domain-containing protein n=1 Tax=Holzapfeliella saturejae TaxID=3082953 RepID=A0ABU8SEC6_9LACO